MMTKPRGQAGRAGDHARGASAGPRQPLSDEELGAIVRPILNPMARAARRILRDGDLANDAIQEALISFWRLPEPPPNPRAWLLRAVSLRSLHLARTRGRRRRHEERASVDRPEPSRRDDPTRPLDLRESSRWVRDLLGRVAPDHRAVITLWAIDEMDYAAIAGLLGIPIGTVRSRLNRGRRAIRQLLADAGLGPAEVDPDASDAEDQQ